MEMKCQSFSMLLTISIASSILTLPTLAGKDFSFSPYTSHRLGCDLDHQWLGEWFEYGERDPVKIHKAGNAIPATVSHKGECIARKGDKYIFKDTSNNCFRCAVMHQKHENVIQYKESLCERRFGRRPTDLCYSIAADSPLKSLFRLNVNKVYPCPIKGAPAYQMTYSRGTGLCSYPMSSVSRCSNDQDGSKLVLRYQACADIPRSESSVEELQCLGSWKEGSTFFFLGLLNHSRVQPHDWEGRFRCFAYQSIHDGYLLSQSGEAKCNLYSPKEGDRTMTLKKLHDPSESCRFPEWIYSSHHQYQNLNRSTKFHFNVQGSSLTILNEADDDSERKMKCHSVQKNDGKSGFARIVAFVTFGCESGFVCLEIERLDDHILTLRTGKLSRNPDEACEPNLFFIPSASPKKTLISSQHYHTRCPLVGKFLVESVANSNYKEKAECESTRIKDVATLTFGCSGESTFSANRGCWTDFMFASEDYTCHGGWQTTRLVQDIGDNEINYEISGYQVTGLFSKPNRSTFLSRREEGESSRYFIVTPRTSESPRLCLRYEDNPRASSSGGQKRLRMMASVDECNRDERPKWRWELVSAGECAQALATANSVSTITLSAMLSVISPAIFVIRKRCYM